MSACSVQSYAQFAEILEFDSLRALKMVFCHLVHLFVHFSTSCLMFLVTANLCTLASAINLSRTSPKTLRPVHRRSPQTYAFNEGITPCRTSWVSIDPSLFRVGITPCRTSWVSIDPSLFREGITPCRMSWVSIDPSLFREGITPCRTS